MVDFIFGIDEEVHTIDLLTRGKIVQRCVSDGRKLYRVVHMPWPEDPRWDWVRESWLVTAEIGWQYLRIWSRDRAKGREFVLDHLRKRGVDVEKEVLHREGTHRRGSAGHH